MPALKPRVRKDTRSVDQSPQQFDLNQVDYRHHAQAGVPFLGQVPQMNADEYNDQTRRVGKTCYGQFDANNPDDVHFGHTLSEVMDLCYLNEYELISHEHYNLNEMDPKTGRPRLFVYVMWIEKYDTTVQNVKHIAQQARQRRINATSGKG